jgi:hypothetical protein
MLFNKIDPAMNFMVMGLSRHGMRRVGVGLSGGSAFQLSAIEVDSQRLSIVW